MGFGIIEGRAGQKTKSPLTASIVLTSQENGLEPQQEFLCQGKIHGYIRFSQRQSGPHQLDSRWIKPSGQVAAESHTSVDFHPARSTAYVWFAFPAHPALGTLDPALEQEFLSSNGTWHLDVRWDSNPILSSTFTVHCP